MATTLPLPLVPPTSAPRSASLRMAQLVQDGLDPRSSPRLIPNRPRERSAATLVQAA